MERAKLLAVNPVLPCRDVFHERTVLRETSWGTREFAFFDPDQNGLTFYCDLEDQ